MRCPPILAALLVAVLSVGGCENPSELDPTGLSSYRHIRAFWSPTGSRIAYTNTDAASLGIWSVDSSGGGSQLIHAGDVGGGTWSADGNWVAFYQTGQIVARKVGSDSVRVLISAPGSLRPTWSTDGRTIAFIRNGVRVYDVASGVETSVSPTGTYVHWIPGTRSVLAVVTAVEAGQFAYTLQRIQVDSGVVRDLMVLRTADDCAFFVPSNDGASVFFGRKPLEGRSEVWSASLTTFQTRQLTTDGGDYPAVSPNGQWVVYTRTAGDDGGLWMMRPDGSQKRRLTYP